MIVEQYGILYTRVCEDDLELIRYWRNQPFIRNSMQFKDYITPLMQQHWFQRINNRHNYYFIIHADHKKIGLINCKEAGPDSAIAEGGIFIWDKSYWGSSVPAFASITMLQAVFEIFKSGTASLATVAVENKMALNFNSILGYKIVGKTADESCYKLLLTRDDYFSKTIKYVKASGNLANNNTEFKMRAEVSDKQSDEINAFILKNKIL